jgi:hypothetical protein
VELELDCEINAASSTITPVNLTLGWSLVEWILESEAVTDRLIIRRVLEKIKSRKDYFPVDGYKTTRSGYSKLIL